jgi:sugar lactone lactonase YvrE
MKPLLLLLAVPSLLLASSPAVWEMSSFSDFIKGKFDGISLARDGRMSLAPKLDTFFSSEQPVIWSVAAGPNGSLYAATGHRGRVFKLDSAGKPQLIWTADRPEVFAIAVDAKGVVYAASSPDGKIYRIENGQASEYFDPKTKYIWTLALAPDGALYAGTSDGGKVFRITAPGKGEEYYSTGQGNVTGLMVDPKGNLLAGTEPNGILYRITAKDKAFALYDASLPEIRAIAQNPDGSIYAVGLGGALAKKVQAAAQSTQTTQGDTSGGTTTTITVTADAGGDLKPTPPEPAKPQQAAPASATPAVTAATTATDLAGVEKSAIYRINPDNTVDTLWSSKEENVYDILPSADGQLYFGTDQSGRIYRLSADRKLTLVAQTNESEAVRLLRWNGALLAATANMGKIYRLGPAGNQAGAKGTYESPVFDAGSIARWGKLRWQGDNGAGSVALRTRSGNSLRPDNTWSDWSAPLTDRAGAQIPSPNARYLQFNAEISGTGPVIDSVSAAYLPQNNPPTVRSITVLTQPVAAATKAPAAQSTSTSSATAVPYSITVTDSGDPTPVASTGTPTQTLSRAASQQLLISWQADDPDSDKLVYDVDFRGDGDGEREWKSLKRNLHDNSVTIDGDALADGRYLFRVTASDREANAAGSARDADLVSSPVLIDNTPPVIHIHPGPTRASIEFDAQDASSALRRAEWSVDAGPWTPLAPVDGIMDSLTERFKFTPAAPAGEHVVVIRVVDSGNNTALARVILH